MEQPSPDVNFLTVGHATGMTVRQGARRKAAALALACVAGACALIEPPTAQLEVSRSAVSQAEAAGAADRAPAELVAAREKLARAEAAIRRGDYVGAERWAEAAEADARLAAMRSRAVAAESGLETTPGAGERPAGDVR